MRARLRGLLLRRLKVDVADSIADLPDDPIARRIDALADTMFERAEPDEEQEDSDEEGAARERDGDGEAEDPVE